MNREQIKMEILQAARVCELRRLAEDTTEEYERAFARSGKRHRYTHDAIAGATVTLLFQRSAGQSRFSRATHEN
jgi:hypothetical protein